MRDIIGRVADYARPRYIETAHTKDGLCVFVDQDERAVEVERDPDGYTRPVMYTRGGDRIYVGTDHRPYVKTASGTLVLYNGEHVLFFHETDGGKPIEAKDDAIRPVESGEPTKGDGSPSPLWVGVYSSILSGWFLGGPVGVASSVLGRIVGQKVGVSTKSLALAMTAGGLVGAASGAIIGSLVGETTGAVVGAVQGALLGGAEPAFGSGRAATRDGAFGGMLLGGILTGQFGAMMGGVVGAVGSKARTPLGRALWGGVAGAALSVASALRFVPPGFLPLAALHGALIGSVGSMGGPVLQQMYRNFTADAAQAMRADHRVALATAGATTGWIAGKVAGLHGVTPVGLAAGGAILVGGAAVLAGMKKDAPPVWHDLRPVGTEEKPHGLAALGLDPRGDFDRGTLSDVFRQAPNLPPNPHPDQDRDDPEGRREEIWSVASSLPQVVLFQGFGWLHPDLHVAEGPPPALPGAISNVYPPLLFDHDAYRFLPAGLADYGQYILAATSVGIFSDMAREWWKSRHAAAPEAPAASGGSKAGVRP